MKKENRKLCLIAAAVLLAAFVLWTVLVCTVDVQPIGPRSSSVGLAAVNGAFHRLTGVHLPLYHATDWLSLIPVAVGAAFAVLGLLQWIRRRCILKVDRSILALGGFYLAVMAAYIFFEYNAVNYRPVLLDGYLEVSYPSSTTLLVLCVMPTAALQLHDRIRSPRLCRWVTGVIAAYTGLMVTGRLLSGVHWLSDIIGGVLLSAGLVLLYAAAADHGRR